VIAVDTAERSNCDITFFSVVELSTGSAVVFHLTFTYYSHQNWCEATAWKWLKWSGRDCSPTSAEMDAAKPSLLGDIRRQAMLVLSRIAGIEDLEETISKSTDPKNTNHYDY